MKLDSIDIVLDSEIFCVRPGFVFWRDREAYLYLDKASVKAGALNASAFETLCALDGKTQVGDVISQVAKALNVDPSIQPQVASDVRTFIASCLQGGLILRGSLRKYLDQFWGESTNSDGYGLALPKLVYWETTTACNLKCGFCYNSCAQVSRKRELSVEEGEELIGRFAKEGLRGILFTGGESTTVFKKLECWIRACTNLGLSTQMITNGTGIDSDRARALKEAGLGYCRVSIHSTDATVHDSIVGVPGSWKLAMRAMEALNAVSLPYAWLVAVGAHNLLELRKCVERAIESKCQGFVAGPLRAIGRGKEMPKYLLSPAQEVQLFRFFDETSTVYGEKIRVSWGANIEIDQAWRQYITEPIRPNFPNQDDFLRWCMHFAKNSVCSIGARTLAMNASGEFILCPTLSEVVLGSAFSLTLRQVWQNEKVALFRRKSLDEFDKCGNCGLRYGCLGGCRANAYYANKSLTGCDQPYKDAMDWLSTNGIEEVCSYYTTEELANNRKSFRAGQIQVGVRVEESGPWAAAFSPSVYASLAHAQKQSE